MPKSIMLQAHHLYDVMADEVHSRPTPAIDVPARISHFAILRETSDRQDERVHLAELCKRYSAPCPAPEAAHYAVHLGHYYLRWEHHTEFSTYTIVDQSESVMSFDRTAIDLAPQDWLEGIGGRMIAACHLVLVAPSEEDWNEDKLGPLFEGQRLIGSRVMEGYARLWTDLRRHGDEFCRYVVKIDQEPNHRTGRLVQRVLEIETYRMAALMAVPDARRDQPAITQLEKGLAEIVKNYDHEGPVETKRDFLERLYRLANDLEGRQAAGAYRYGAARAYAAIVKERLKELDEARLDPLQPLTQFMARRFEPAMRLCESTSERFASLSERVVRASHLLRAGVDVTMQEQQRDLLDSMNKRADLQLRLQETVEGLSVIAVSYYAIGLLSYIFNGIIPGNMKSLVIAAVVLPVIVAVWWALRRFRASD